MLDFARAARVALEEGEKLVVISQDWGELRGPQKWSIVYSRERGGRRLHGGMYHFDSMFDEWCPQNQRHRIELHGASTTEADFEALNEQEKLFVEVVRRYR